MHTTSHEESGNGRRIGVCSWSLRPSNPRDLIAQLEATGLDALQIALLPLVDEPRVWADTIGILRERGIRILSGMFATPHEDYSTLDSIRETGGVRPDATWPQTLESAIRVADLAGEAGLDLVTLHAGFIPHAADDPLREVMLERLRQVVDVFAQRGIRTGFETGQETASTMLEALEDLGRPEAGVNFDPANMILYGMGDPLEGIRILAPRVLQVHIKDALPTEVPGTWGAEVPAGEGAVDWDGFLAAVDGLPGGIDLVIEREAGDARVADVLTARELIRKRTDARDASESGDA